jgi:hypothetical protein
MSLDVHIGETRFQVNLQYIFSQRGNYIQRAELVLDRDAPGEVAVYIDGLIVGYLSRKDGRKYREGNYPRSCTAMIQTADYSPVTLYGLTLDLNL